MKEQLSYHIIDQEAVDKVEKLLPEKEIIDKLATFFSAIKDPTRLRILHALFINEMCVYDIATVLNMSQSAISHQLKVLKQANLVDYSKQGKLVYYSLADEHVRSIINQSTNHIKE
jgi:DNA-binding transcriptional ArsR family regulator